MRKRLAEILRAWADALDPRPKRGRPKKAHVADVAPSLHGWPEEPA